MCIQSLSQAKMYDPEPLLYLLNNGAVPDYINNKGQSSLDLVCDLATSIPLAVVLDWITILFQYKLNPWYSDKKITRLLQSIYNLPDLIRNEVWTHILKQRQHWSWLDLGILRVELEDHMIYYHNNGTVQLPCKPFGPKHVVIDKVDLNFILYIISSLSLDYIDELLEYCDDESIIVNNQKEILTYFFTHLLSDYYILLPLIDPLYEELRIKDQQSSIIYKKKQFQWLLDHNLFESSHDLIHITLLHEDKYDKEVLHFLYPHHNDKELQFEIRNMLLTVLPYHFDKLFDNHSSGFTLANLIILSNDIELVKKILPFGVTIDHVPSTYLDAFSYDDNTQIHPQIIEMLNKCIR